MTPHGLSLLAQVSSLGTAASDISAALFSKDNSPLQKEELYSAVGARYVGRIKDPLPSLPEQFTRFNSRLTQIALLLLKNCEAALEDLQERTPPHRIGVVLGSSTSGIEAAERAYVERGETSQFPDWYDYSQQEIGSVASFVAKFLGITGPAYVISTACSSAAKAFGSARALLASGICDAVITGGLDSLCKLTVGGFGSLELLSPGVTNPFSKNRDGLNIGEGGALFLLTKNQDAPFQLLGVGEASDAYHISTPHPEGLGASTAIDLVLKEAGASAKNVAYMNLHGTGTVLNDQMESIAVANELGFDVPCSSTKPLTGHTLGAAGAIEAAFCCLALEHRHMPVHRFDGERDDALPGIRLVDDPEKLDPRKIVLSNSFAFGGSNCCLALGRS